MNFHPDNASESDPEDLPPALEEVTSAQLQTEKLMAENDSGEEASAEASENSESLSVHEVSSQSEKSEKDELSDLDELD